MSTNGSTTASGTTAITIVLAVVGGVALLGSGVTAASAAAGELNRTDSVQTLDVAGIKSIQLEGSASEVRVEFADVADAELSVTDGRGDGWTLEREDDDLVVRSNDGGFGSWFGGGRGFGFGSDEARVVLTLPERLQTSGLDASLTLTAGKLDVDGEFDELDVTVNAGRASVSGAAKTLELEVSAGGADVRLDGVAEADLGVSAGDVAVELTGTAPTQTSIDVSAGSLDLTLPAGGYNVVQDVSAGKLDNRLDESTSGGNSVDVSLSAGKVTLRPAR